MLQNFGFFKNGKQFFRSENKALNKKNYSEIGLKGRTTFKSYANPCFMCCKDKPRINLVSVLDAVTSTSTQCMKFRLGPLIVLDSL